MKWIACVLSALLIFCISINGYADTKGAIQSMSWEDYRIVVERNIFSSERDKKMEPASTPPPVPDPVFIDCTGVLITLMGSVAFFEGSMFDGTRSLREGKVIAGHRIVNITTDSLTLRRNDKPIVLPVGARLITRAGDKWEIEKRSYKIESPETGSQADGGSSQERSTRFGSMFGDERFSRFIEEMRPRGRR